MTENGHDATSAIRAKRAFGKRLRTRREKLGLSQSELARVAQTRQATISRIEGARRLAPDAVLKRIERVLEDAAAK